MEKICLPLEISMFPLKYSLSEMLSICKCICCVPGGVETVCYNLVHSNRRLISTVPSLVSTMMQHLSSARMPSGGSASNRAKAGSEADNTDGMQNFAPLGTVVVLMIYCRLDRWFISHNALDV